MSTTDGAAAWRELAAPWSCVAGVLVLAGCYWPALLLALGCALDALAALAPLGSLLSLIHI